MEYYPDPRKQLGPRSFNAIHFKIIGRSQISALGCQPSAPSSFIRLPFTKFFFVRHHRLVVPLSFFSSKKHFRLHFCCRSFLLEETHVESVVEGRAVLMAGDAPKREVELRNGNGEGKKKKKKRINQPNIGQIVKRNNTASSIKKHIWSDSICSRYKSSLMFQHFTSGYTIRMVASIFTGKNGGRYDINELKTIPERTEARYTRERKVESQNWIGQPTQRTNPSTSRFYYSAGKKSEPPTGRYYSRPLSERDWMSLIVFF